MNDQRYHGFDRRTFLRRGAAATIVAAGVTGGLTGSATAGASPLSGAALPAPGGPPVWSVGFVPARQDERTAVVPLRRVLGDNRLREAGAARVTVSGLYRAETRPDVAAIDVDVAFAPGGERLVHAWRYARDPVVQNGPSNAMVVPVALAEGLFLAIDARDEGAGGGRDAGTVRLAFRSRSGLRPGHYVVGLRSARTGRLPRWGAIAAAPGGLPGEEWLRDGLGEGAPAVDFPFVVITVAPTTA